MCLLSWLVCNRKKEMGSIDSSRIFDSLLSNSIFCSMNQYTITYERCISTSGKSYTRWTILKDGKKHKSGSAKTNSHAEKRAIKVLAELTEQGEQ